jgi:predicted nucleic acid-binding protein
LNVFLDSSALAKRYVEEPGSDRLEEMLSSDSLHIASAAEWSAELFVSAGERQCTAARAYGLRTEKLPAG